MRLTSLLLMIIGAGVAAVPFFAAGPNDELFFSVLRGEDKTEGEWRVRGTLYDRGTTYTYTAEKRYVLNEAGDIIAHEAVLQANETSGKTKLYRRTRYFNQWGAPAEHVEESPTRTIKRGRGPSGEEDYRETILSDQSPLLARSLVRKASHGLGALLAACGLAGLFFRRRLPLAVTETR